jgi:flagellar biosynthesis/type III secretory pathway M-ring protein FliF/YscJ
MEIKTKVFDAMKRLNKDRLTVCFVIIIMCMLLTFFLVLDYMEKRHAAEIENVKNRTETEIYNFLTR